MNPTPSQRVMLEMIQSHDSLWNWYKLARATLGLWNREEDYKLQPMFDAGWVEQRFAEGETHASYFITDAGRDVLKSTQTESQA